MPSLEEQWRSLVRVAELVRAEEKWTANQHGNLHTAEGRALWRQQQAKQNMIGHQATEFLKAHGLTWDGRSRKRIPGL